MRNELPERLEQTEGACQIAPAHPLEHLPLPSVDAVAQQKRCDRHQREVSGRHVPTDRIL